LAASRLRALAEQVRLAQEAAGAEAAHAAATDAVQELQAQ
jgi:hypothetical protein